MLSVLWRDKVLYITLYINCFGFRCFERLI